MAKGFKFKCIAAQCTSYARYAVHVEGMSDSLSCSEHLEDFVSQAAGLSHGLDAVQVFMIAPRPDRSYPNSDHPHTWYEVETLDVTVATACSDANGDPAFFVSEHNIARREYEGGIHYEKAEAAAKAAEYSGPFVHFDQQDAARMPWLFENLLAEA